MVKYRILAIGNVLCYVQAIPLIQKLVIIKITGHLRNE